jgi:membrane protease YdiL (CAAX protease family)
MELFHQWWLPYGFAFGLFQGTLAEELGWRGFLLPRLLSDYSPFLASVILGVVSGSLAYQHVLLAPVLVGFVHGKRGRTQYPDDRAVLAHPRKHSPERL